MYSHFWWLADEGSYTVTNHIWNSKRLVRCCSPSMASAAFSAVFVEGIAEYPTEGGKFSNHSNNKMFCFALDNHRLTFGLCALVDVSLASTTARTCTYHSTGMDAPSAAGLFRCKVRDVLVLPSTFISTFPFALFHSCFRHRASVLRCTVCRWIYLDGCKYRVFTAHSLVLCFMFGPIGLLSHIATRQFQKENRQQDSSLASS